MTTPHPRALLSLILTTGLCAGCSQPVAKQPSSLSTVSPQAAAKIESMSYTSVPALMPIKASQIVDMRRDYAKTETPIEDAMIRQFGLEVERTTIAGVPVTVITPGTIAPEFKDAAAVNIHGGSFVLGGPRDRTALMIAKTLGIKVYSIDYTLAPEAKFPVAIDQSLAVYKDLAARLGAKHLMASSTSAGGGIMLAMLLKAHAAGVALPKAQVLFTPASDISGAGDSFEANQGRDMLDCDTTLRIVKTFYIGDRDAADPQVSPIYARYPADFPASIVVSGTRDLLLSDSVRLSWKLKEAGVKSELLVGEGMWHGYTFEYEMPETVATMRSVADFLRDAFRR